MEKKLRFNRILFDISHSIRHQTCALATIAIAFSVAYVLSITFTGEYLKSDTSPYIADQRCKQMNMSLHNIEDKTNYSFPSGYNNKYACYDKETNYMLLLKY